MLIINISADFDIYQRLEIIISSHFWKKETLLGSPVMENDY